MEKKRRLSDVAKRNKLQRTLRSISRFETALIKIEPICSDESDLVSGIRKFVENAVSNDAINGNGFMTRYVDLYPVNVGISINSISRYGNNAFVRIRGRCDPDNSEYDNSFLRSRIAFLARNEPGRTLLQPPGIFLSRNSYLAEYHNTRNNARIPRTVDPFELGKTEIRKHCAHTKKRSTKSFRNPSNLSKARAQSLF